MIDNEITNHEMTAPSKIYLDYAATTPVDPRVAEKMTHYLTIDGVFGNPASSAHAFGQAAAKAVDNARAAVASLIGADPREIIWTSGATESDNLAIKGVAQQQHKKGKHIITAKTEHKAVLDACAYLARQGFDITYLSPDSQGCITAEKVASALRDETILVSLMYVNNETGSINDIAAIGQLTRARGITFHVDGAQATGKIAIDVNADNIDLLSLTAHKTYGPKGIGALYVRRKPRVRLSAQMHGGGHERGMRSGTLPTHQIVGMGEAYHLAQEELERDSLHIKVLSDRFWAGIKDLPDVSINGESGSRLSNILNIQFGALDAQALMRELNALAISSGSACISATSDPSHVLTAMGLSRQQAAASLRFSFGRMTTTDDVDRAVALICQAVRAA